MLVIFVTLITVLLTSAPYPTDTREGVVRQRLALLVRAGPSTIHGHAGRGTGILNNELYIGRLIWNRQRYITPHYS